MAWTSARTWVTNEVVTETIMNTHVRDNLNALRSRAIATASGFNSATYAFMTWTSVLDDFGTSFSGGTFWTAPWTGRFDFTCYIDWTGASGSGPALGVRAERYTSAPALVEEWAEATNIEVNGKLCIAGGGVMNATDRLYIAAYNTAGAAAGTLAARLVVKAAG